MLPRVSLNFGNLNRSNSLIRNLKNLSVLKNYFCPYINTTSQKRCRTNYGNREHFLGKNRLSDTNYT